MIVISHGTWDTNSRNFNALSFPRAHTSGDKLYCTTFQKFSITTAEMAGQMASLFTPCCQRVHFFWNHPRKMEASIFDSFLWSESVDTGEIYGSKTLRCDGNYRSRWKDSKIAEWVLLVVRIVVGRRLWNVYRSMIRYLRCNRHSRSTWPYEIASEKCIFSAYGPNDTILFW